MAPPGPGVRRLDLGRRQRVQLFFGALLPLVLGACAEIAAIADLTVPAHSGATRVVLAVLGLPFLAAGAGLFAWLLRAPPQALLDVDDGGLTLTGRRGVDWRLGWADLTSAVVVRTRARLNRRTQGTSNYVTITPPHHYLQLYVTAAAVARPEVADLLAGPNAERRNVNLDLGVSTRSAHEVLDAMAAHLAEPGVVRLGPGEPGPGETY